jgi:D-3-phosphoglycerate dehydrogenase
MKVLIADKFEESGRRGLEAAGCQVIFQPDAKDAALAAALRESAADVLIVRSTSVTEAMMDGGSLKLIVRAGAGYNTIDVAAASKRGIYVSNCPGKNSVAVAELAFGLTLSLDRRIPDNVIALRQGQWNKKEFSKAKGLHGQTIGLVGLGQIGREMIPRARAFGLRIIAWSRSLTPEMAEQLEIERAGNLIELAKSADIVSVHLALKPETRGLIDAAFFDSMRPGSCFINTARGEIVDQAALTKAMQAKGIRAGLDVFAAEPTAAAGEFADPIKDLPNLYGTHHIGASTDQAQEAIAAETVRIIRTFKETGHVPNVVNLARRTLATHSLVIRHRDRPGVLAHVLTALRATSINVQEMENIIFDSAQAAVARINLDKAPSEQTLAQLRDHPEILDSDLLELKAG